jgi:hypothetical protein
MWPWVAQDILHKTQRRVGNWIGSSVIHLGDHNVPNALHFIDKYTQVGSPSVVRSSGRRAQALGGPPIAISRSRGSSPPS